MPFFEIFSFVLALVLATVVHRMGHLLLARLYKIKVRPFSPFFNPAAGGKKKKGGESMLDDLKATTSQQERERRLTMESFNSRSKRVRAFVLLGGIIFNILLAIVIYTVSTYNRSEEYISKEEINRHGIYPMEIGKLVGFQIGDRIVNVNGQTDLTYHDLIKNETWLDKQSYFVVERNGRQVKITLPENFLDLVVEYGGMQNFIRLQTPFTVKQVMEGSSAERAGLRIGDRIVQVDDDTIRHYPEFINALKDKANETIELAILRDEKFMDLTTTISAEGKIGILVNNELNYSTKRYNLGTSIVIGTAMALDVWADVFRYIKKQFTRELKASRSLSGPVGIAELFQESFWQLLFNKLAKFSMIFALIHLIPLPFLDGGKIVRMFKR